MPTFITESRPESWNTEGHLQKKVKVAEIKYAVF